jgi:3-isopropylmalate/(R)-2-methylmalate dehydratase small subunit
MSPNATIEGVAAVIDIENLDTDQIMPKQFLRGIDKGGLDKGLLWDLRFDASGTPRPGFVLNLPAFAGTRILIGGANFGCGSSREHAVWGLQQFGIRAVIAPSFGEIFYSNALNNGLLALILPVAAVGALKAESAQGAAPLSLVIDLEAMTVRSAQQAHAFQLTERHRRMLLEGIDMIGATLAMKPQIDAFALAHGRARPWLSGVADTLKGQRPAR